MHTPQLILDLEADLARVKQADQLDPANEVAAVEDFLAEQELPDPEAYIPA